MAAAGSLGGDSWPLTGLYWAAAPVQRPSHGRERQSLVAKWRSYRLFAPGDRLGETSGCSRRNLLTGRGLAPPNRTPAPLTLDHDVRIPRAHSEPVGTVFTLVASDASATAFETYDAGLQRRLNVCGKGSAMLGCQ